MPALRSIVCSTLAVALGMLVAGGCAGPAASGSGSTSPPGGPETVAAEPATAPPASATTTATVVGGRCQAAGCTCRNRNGNPAESPPPAEDQKRFEIRLAGEDGSASLDAGGLGKFTAGSNEACFYVDVAPGTTHAITFFAKEGKPEAGVGPMLSIAEYGPKGPYWYRVVEVRCAGPGRKCTREAAAEWGTEARQRKRGRIDPCGSSVITKLNWQTSGGAAARDSGLYRDFTVSFTMEVKKFATQFAPGSTECVPK